MDNEKMIDSIRKLCKSHNISPTRLEEDLGFSQGLISRWKDKTPSLDKIIDIADYFHISLDEVVGRNTTDIEPEDDFVITLTKITQNKLILWREITDYNTHEINGKLYEDLFNLYNSDGDDDEKVEIYCAEYNQADLFLVVQYKIDDGIIQELDLCIYLQPDQNSLPVLQRTEDKLVKELWLDIREKYMGIPDELKAEKVKAQIMNSGKEAMLKDMDKYFQIDLSNTEQQFKDEYYILINTYKPELNQLISIFSDPQMKNAIKFAQKIAEHCNATEIAHDTNKKDDKE